MVLPSKYEILLLCGQNEIREFSRYLRAINPSIRVSGITRKSQLIELSPERLRHVRLIAFLTDVIVPADILSMLGPVPYNIHPGPPEYPGYNPVSFALWEQATHFGVTAHEMETKVDSGKIVFSQRFQIPPNSTRLELGNIAYTYAVDLFKFIARHCALHYDALKTSDIQWCTKKTTRSDFVKLCDKANYIKGDQSQLLLRACGPDLKIALR